MLFQNFFSQSRELISKKNLQGFRLKMLSIAIIAMAVMSFLFGVLDVLGIQKLGLAVRYADFTMSFISVSLFIFLHRFPKSYIYIVYILSMTSFILFAIILQTTPADSFRMIWFFLLIVVIFMLHSIRWALFIALSSLAFIWGSYADGDLNINETTIRTILSSIASLTVMLYFYTKRINDYEELLDEKNRRLHQLASHDPLTGIKNRRMFLEVANKYFKNAQRKSTPLHMIMFDIDFFKKINDNYGHQAGDEVLMVMSKSISEMLRGDDIFGRIGGEEFAIVVLLDDIKKVENVAEKIRLRVSSLVFDFMDESLTISIGVASSKDASSLEDLMNKADKLMYEAKDSGRNCVRSL